MPGYAPPVDQWLAQKLGQLSGDVAALKTQSTEYIVDAEGVCRAIIGHLVAEPDGTSTGLEGWGVAVLGSEGWILLSVLGPEVAALKAPLPRLRVASELTLPNKAGGSEEKLAPGTVEFDNREWWNASTHEYIPQTPGIYLAGAYFNGSVVQTSGTFADIAVAKNGSSIQLARCEFNTSLSGAVMDTSTIIEMNGTSDTIELFGNSTMAANKGQCALWAVFLGA
jgi:hypothetical protein